MNEDFAQALLDAVVQQRDAALGDLARQTARLTLSQAENAALRKELDDLKAEHGDPGKD